MVRYIIGLAIAGCLVAGDCRAATKCAYVGFGEAWDGGIAFYVAFSGDYAVTWQFTAPSYVSGMTGYTLPGDAVKAAAYYGAIDEAAGAWLIQSQQAVIAREVVAAWQGGQSSAAWATMTSSMAYLFSYGFGAGPWGASSITEAQVKSAVAGAFSDGAGQLQYAAPVGAKTAPGLSGASLPYQTTPGEQGYVLAHPNGQFWLPTPTGVTVGSGPLSGTVGMPVMGGGSYTFHWTTAVTDAFPGAAVQLNKWKGIFRKIAVAFLMVVGVVWVWTTLRQL